MELGTPTTVVVGNYLEDFQTEPHYDLAPDGRFLVLDDEEEVDQAIRRLHMSKIGLMSLSGSCLDLMGD